MDYRLRRFTVGEAIGKGFSVFLDHFFQFLIVGFIFGALWVVSLWGLSVTLLPVISGLLEDRSVINFIYIFVFSLISIILTFIMTGFLARDIALKFLGSAAPAAELLTTLKAMPSVVIVSLLGILAASGGTLLLIFPGIYIGLGFFFSAQCAVIEGLGPIAAMKRSWRLAKNRRVQIFGLSFLVGLITNVIHYGLDFVVTVVLKQFMDETTGAILLGLIPTGVALAFSLPLTVGTNVVFYLGLRVEDESLDVERLARDFGVEKTEPDPFA